MSSEPVVGLGSVLDGRYRLDKTLGEGGFGVVYRAVQLSTGQSVAVKLLHAHIASGEHGDELVARFRRELAVIARLQHPNIVRLLDAGSLPNGQLYAVLEFVEGETLASLIERSGRLPADQVRILMSDVLEALGAAHAAGIVHRDIKPANIMVTASGPRPRAIVLDFGIAGVVCAQPGQTLTALTQAGRTIGTLLYMAPEQLEGHAGPPADLYAWGLVLYECLLGRAAIQASSVVEVLRHHSQCLELSLPPEPAFASFDRVLRRATARDLARRASSAAELLSLLEVRTPTHRSGPPLLLLGLGAIGLVIAIAVIFGLGFVIQRRLAANPLEPAELRLVASAQDQDSEVQRLFAGPTDDHIFVRFANGGGEAWFFKEKSLEPLFDLAEMKAFSISSDGRRAAGLHLFVPGVSVTTIASQRFEMGFTLDDVILFDWFGNDSLVQGDANGKLIATFTFPKEPRELGTVPGLHRFRRSGDGHSGLLATERGELVWLDREAAKPIVNRTSACVGKPATIASGAGAAAAIACPDGAVVWFDADANELRRWPPRPARVEALAFDAKAQLLAIGDSAGELCLWRVEGEQAVACAKLSAGVSALLVLGPDDAPQVFVGDATGGLYLFSHELEGE